MQNHSDDILLWMLQVVCGFSVCRRKPGGRKIWDSIYGQDGKPTQMSGVKNSFNSQVKEVRGAGLRRLWQVVPARAAVLQLTWLFTEGFFGAWTPCSTTAWDNWFVARALFKSRHWDESGQWRAARWRTLDLFLQILRLTKPLWVRRLELTDSQRRCIITACSAGNQARISHSSGEK